MLRSGALRPDHLDDLLQGGAFRQHLGLCLNIHRYPRRTVPQQLLHYLDALSVGLEKRCIRVSKGVPRDPFRDAQSLDRWLDGTVPRMHDIARLYLLLHNFRD